MTGGRFDDDASRDGFDDADDPRAGGIRVWAKRCGEAHDEIAGMKISLAIREDRIERLLRSGAMLATCAFNLKQRDHLTERERRSLRESQEAWDAVTRTIPS